MHNKSHSVRRQPSADDVGGGASSQTAADFVVRFSTVESSSIHEKTGTPQYSITGIMGFEGVAGEPASVTFAGGMAEGVNNAEIYTSPGIIGRPLPPRTIKGVDEHMDVICVQTVEGLVPIAYRDNRLQMAGDSAPGEGVLAFVGYGGSFFSQTPVESGGDPAGGGGIQVIYCPYDFDDAGVAQKAHTIILDPTPDNESIIIAHANGLAITMSDQDKHAIVMKNKAGDASIRCDDDGVTLNGSQIVLNGTVILGDNTTAVPLLAGAASPPSTKVFVSP